MDPRWKAYLAFLGAGATLAVGVALIQSEASAGGYVVCIGVALLLIALWIGLGETGAHALRVRHVALDETVLGSGLVGVAVVLLVAIAIAALVDALVAAPFFALAVIASIWVAYTSRRR